MWGVINSHWHIHSSRPWENNIQDSEEDNLKKKEKKGLIPSWKPFMVPTWKHLSDHTQEPWYLGTQKDENQQLK